MRAGSGSLRTAIVIVALFLFATLPLQFVDTPSAAALNVLSPDPERQARIITRQGRPTLSVPVRPMADRRQQVEVLSIAATGSADSASDIPAPAATYDGAHRTLFIPVPESWADTASAQLRLQLSTPYVRTTWQADLTGRRRIRISADTPTARQPAD